MAKGTVVKTLLAGVAGGAIALSGGVIYQAAQGNGTSDTSLPSSSNTSAASAKQVKKVNVDVNSDTTKAISTIKNAVVSILNYQEGGDLSNLSDSQIASEGSGVIYKKEGGKAYIVTNNHVIAQNSSLEVLLSSGQKVKATVVGSDVYTDLAVLTIDDKDVTTVATFADSANLNVGEPAIAVGSPLGSEYANTATEGIISASSRTVTLQDESGKGVSSTKAIQTDAAINPGNSGGALININGQVIGITSSKISATGSSSGGSIAIEGMGFAIPSNTVVDIVAQLEKNGKIVRPLIGINMANLTNVPQKLIDSLELPKSVTTGVYIASVQNGLPAAKAGLKASDVITKVGDTPIETTADLTTALYKYNIGDTVKITFYRKSEEKTVSVKLDKEKTDSDSSSSNDSDKSGD